MMKSEFTRYLTEISKGDDIAAEVCQEALDHEDHYSFFHDLAQHGCISWLVSSLIYYEDTHSFFDRHYREIENLREHVQVEIGEVRKIEGDLKNWFTWFAFEWVAGEIMRRWYDQ